MLPVTPVCPAMAPFRCRLLRFTAAASERGRQEVPWNLLGKDVETAETSSAKRLKPSAQAGTKASEVCALARGKGPIWSQLGIARCVVASQPRSNDCNSLDHCRPSDNIEWLTRRRGALAQAWRRRPRTVETETIGSVSTRDLMVLACSARP